jgi:hypothetical protein
MTATTPPAGQPAVWPQPSGPAAATGLGGAVLLVGTRIALWVGVQLLVAGLLVLGGAGTGQPLNAAAAWWMVYGALIDLGTLGVIGWLLRRDGSSYRSLLGPSTAAWQVALGALGVLAASVPAMVFSAELNRAFYGAATPPMLAVVVIWAAEHAFFPLLISDGDGSLDLKFAAYRVVSVLPFLATWTALYYAFDRRLLPIMAARWVFNGGTALALTFGLVG